MSGESANSKTLRSVKDWVIIALLLVCFLPFFCTANASDTTEVEFRISIPNVIAMGQNVSLNYDLQRPTDMRDPSSVKWESSAPEVASVNGKSVTGKAVGTATITCTAVFPNGMTFSDQIEVEVYIPVKRITLSQKELSLNTGSTNSEITAEIYPQDAKYQRITWESSDKAIVTVNEQGKVTAVKAGTATISAQTTDPSCEKMKAATCTVVVFQPTKQISFAKGALEVARQGSVAPEVLFVPDDVSDKTLIWTSADGAIASVSAKGIVQGQEIGITTITVKDKQGNSANCSIEVYVPVKSVRISQKDVVLNSGDTSHALQAVIAPENAKYQSVKWESSDETIAMIDDDGKLTALKAGDCVISATTLDPAGAKVKTATCKITVFQPTEGITFDEASCEVGIKQSITLTPIFSPTDASDQTVIWSSSDDEIVTITSKGLASGKGIGTVTVTAADSQGNEAVCKVTVYQTITSISFSQKEMTLKTGETSEAIIASIVPGDAKYRTLTWTTSDETVATVDSQGHVTAVKAGTVNISAEPDDPFAEKTKAPICKVTVLQPVEALAFEQTEYRVARGKTINPTVLFSPEDASAHKLLWTSTDRSIVAVNDNGLVRGVSAGTAEIIVEATDGTGVKSRCTITVYEAVTSIKLSKSKLAITKGETGRIAATVKPANATDPELRWVSSNPLVATVSNGVITASSVGKTTITAESTDGSGKTASMTFYTEPINPITIESISTYYYYNWDINCLFITPQNLTQTRTIKEFAFTVELYSGTRLLDTSSCMWSGGGFRAFGPGKQGASGSWHWYGLTYITIASKICITPTWVEFSDGTIVWIPINEQNTSVFYM